MRKILIILVIALFAGVGLHLVLNHYQGYLLLSAGNYVIETSLWGAIVLIFMVMIAIYALWTFWKLVILPRHWWRSLMGKKDLHGRNLTLQGMLDYFGGNWPQAAENFERGLKRSPNQAVNYMGAASAHYNLGDHRKVEKLLKNAEDGGSDDANVMEILRLRVLIQEQKFEKALPRIEKLHRQLPNHPTVLRLLTSTKKALADWTGLEALLADLKKHHALSAAELERLEQDIYQGIILGFEKTRNKNKAMTEQQSELDHLWDRLPNRLQKMPLLMAAYIQQLQKLGMDKKAETRLRRFINRQWDISLVAVYGRLQADSASQLVIAEAWLLDHPDDVVVLQALARICVRSQLWGKAKSYYESAIRINANPQMWLELGDLLKVLDDSKGSHDCFRKGLQQATGL